ncbi:hypothetical protein U9M48_025764 [Paspalum notatum var. saurae]|uniref:Uncharacterized protein n=1 Tax=Paspalum notatum var. saurae TaxID=547442 RepID=A0AAQ3TQK4_PASNO
MLTWMPRWSQVYVTSSIRVVHATTHAAASPAPLPPAACPIASPAHRACRPRAFSHPTPPPLALAAHAGEVAEEGRDAPIIPPHEIPPPTAASNCGSVSSASAGSASVVSPS